MGLFYTKAGMVIAGGAESQTKEFILFHCLILI